jgi:hypothetical protein
MAKLRLVMDTLAFTVLWKLASSPLMADELTGKTVPLQESLSGRAILTGKPILAARPAERISGYADDIDNIIAKIRNSIFRLQPRDHDLAGLRAQHDRQAPSPVTWS